ncbi:unnamed protein product [Penicillium salamii]|uniref:Uncharacterized protein n=1 Tax=Penicillium salamii TaxID=1612424 RepID=A0A9W4NI54_9EURO|nr:unnamed protein product [Penicillium salamii]
MEAAGLVVAILPLVINQLDNYVQGLQTIKGFKAKHYRRELEGYLSTLGPQQAIFVNTMERALGDAVKGETESEELSPNFMINLLKRQDLEASLREKLGRDFPPFSRTVNELALLLEELSHKLGLDKSISVKDYGVNVSLLKKVLRKFKNIFSKSIYLDLFARIDTANGILKTLVEQSDHREVMKTHSIVTRDLGHERRIRKLAYSLHKAILEGKHWKCACLDQHSVCFVLSDLPDNTQETSCHARFRLIFPPNSAKDLGDERNQGLEVEAKSDTITSNLDSLGTPSLQDSPRGPHAKSAFHNSSEVKPGPGPHETTPDINSVPPIVDICSALSAIGAQSTMNDPIGCISDEMHRQNIYFVRKLAGDLTSQSLAELIGISNSSRALSGAGLFTWARRLRVAVVLASSVLQFYGSWMKA